MALKNPDQYTADYNRAYERGETHKQAFYYAEMCLWLRVESSYMKGLQGWRRHDALGNAIGFASK